jgi:hypothetical protein
MSTKIYDAYEWKGSIEELMPVLIDYRNTYQTELREHLYDSPFVLKLLKEYGVDFELEKNIVKELTEATRSMERHPFAFEASVVVLLHKGRIFVKKFGFGGWFKPTELEHEKLVDFHYQNQVDTPDDVSYEEFEERGRVWDEILGSRGVIGKVGLSYDFFEEYDIWDVAVSIGSEHYRRQKESVKTNEV